MPLGLEQMTSKEKKTMIKVNKNSLPQALPLKQYEPKPYDKEAARKYAESLEKLLPLLNEMENAVKAMQAKRKELEALQQRVAAWLKS